MRNSNTFELIGLGLCILAVAVTVFQIQTRSAVTAVAQPSSVQNQAALAVVGAESDTQLTEVNKEIPKDMTINDITLGAGAEAVNGATVSVHYVGRLDNGTEFDNSHKRGAPIEFTLGAGQVIAGWEEGILGMKVGGERTLVIPPDKAYGDAGIGPIPPNATLTFTVELVAVN